MSEITETCEPAKVRARPLIVDVYAYLEGEDVLFSQAWKREGDAKRSKGRIDIPHGQQDTPIHFHLHDRTGLRLSFMSPAADAMWVALDDCPTCKGDAGQIVHDSVSQNQLKVTDLNAGKACTLHYALRFDGNATVEGPPYEYDPEIRNGGSS
jgi:hypothetical protein